MCKRRSVQSSRQPESLQDLLSYSNDRSFSDSGTSDDDQQMQLWISVNPVDVAQQDGQLVMRGNRSGAGAASVDLLGDP